MMNLAGWHGGSARTIKYLTDEQVSAFFAVIKHVEDPVTKARDNALFHLMLSLGLRCLEAAILRVDSVNLKVTPPQIYVTRVKEKHVKLVQGERVRMDKARRGDWYSLSDKDAHRLRVWLKARKALRHAEASPFLFLTRQAPSISTASINRLVHEYGEKAGMPEIHPHMLRHTCGVRLAKAGRNAFAIQKRLGHVSVISTQIYVDLAGPDKVEEDRADNAAIEGDDE